MKIGEWYEDLKTGKFYKIKNIYEFNFMKWVYCDVEGKTVLFVEYK